MMSILIGFILMGLTTMFQSWWLYKTNERIHELELKIIKMAYDFDENKV